MIKETFIMTPYGAIPEAVIKKYFKKRFKITPKVPMDIDYYVRKLSEKLEYGVPETYHLLNTLLKVYPAAALNLLLREVAVKLDKQYEDHIEDSEKIFIVSTLDGRIHEACKGHIKNYRNFAAFRTMEDARIACRILRDILKECFSGRKQKD